MTPQTPEQIAGKLTKGAAKACLNMADDYQFPGKATFDVNGAWSLFYQKTGRGKGALCEQRLVRPDPAKRFTRHAYRLTPLGLQARAILRGEEA